jgi:amino acid adenylation domain-containing protein
MKSSHKKSLEHGNSPLKSIMVDRASVLNDPPKVLSGPELLHDLIDFQNYGDACAIDFTCIGERREYSYRAVQSCVASLVSQIEKLLATDDSGVTQSSIQHIVPILLPQSPGLYISQLAILLSGGAFCPINLDAPKERIRFVVGDVSANLIITTSEFKETVSWENGPTVIIVDQFPTAPEEQELRIGRSREASSHELAYVMYTSGSSGVPKGVAVSHLAVTQSLLAHEKLLPPFKRFLQFAAPSFDVSVFEIFFPLSRGCTLVGCDRSQLLNDLPGMIDDLGVDAAELTPTVVGSLLQKRSNAPKLKLLLTIGEMLTTPIVEEFGGSETKESMLYGMYGPTEAAIHCTIHPRMAASAKPGNIGVPFETISAFVAAASSASDEAGRIKFLSTGELGELVLGGPQLAQGYLNREEQNKAAFINSQGKSYYRTGDKARFLKDGTIEILGRMSAGQVKLRGQRIELGEIEEAVYKHPGIKTVAAVVLSGALVVFALTDDRMLRPGKITETCAKWLPKFMVPGEIVLLNSFPYLPSGKVDKRRLEADYQNSLEENEDENDVSATPTVRIVEETLLELLGPFSRKTRLTAAGLDSLVAIRVASKLRASGFNLTAVSVLQAETLTELTRLCETAQSAPEEKLPSKSLLPATGDVINSLNGSAKDVVHTMACTPLQSAMLSETAVHRKAYINWVELDLLGISDADLVVLALENLAEHISILRTGFAESKDADGFVQVVWKKLSSSQVLKVNDFIHEFEPSKDLSLHRPLRIQIRNVGSSTKLLIHLHHALYDAWSLDLLLDDLDNLLMGRSPPSRPSFSNVVEAYLDGTLKIEAPNSKDYWKDHLSDLDVRQVPNFHNAKCPVPGLAIANLETSISTSDVEHAAKSLYSSPQSLFQAAYALVLSSYLGTSDLCFGTVFSGRTLPIADVEDIVGPCLATLPVRVDIAASTTARDLVQDLNAINRKHLKHSALPLRNIKSACGVHPRQPLFDTLIIWQQTLRSYDHTRQHVSLIESVDNLEFNLTLEIIPGKGNVELKANYQQSLFPKSQINLLLKQIEQLVRAIVRDQSFPLDAAFGQLTNDVLSIENEHPQTALKPGTLSSPVERIALEDPDRPAIQFAKSIDGANFESQVATYSQLNSRANQIGHNLLSQGVLPDELVCICIEKSVDLYASILATAKVGTGYLPVTPDIPSERLRYILREAGVKIILAQSQSRPLLKSFYDVVIAYVDEIKFSELPFDNISPRSTPDNISYCVFTSGSTGIPKGVLVTQGNLLSNLDVLEDLYPATKETRLLQSCSQAFDVSVFEIFFTWRIGGCLCSAVKDVLFRDIENAIRALEVTHLSLTPTVAALVDPRNVSGVKFLVTAGEAVTQKVFNAWADNGLYQGYGPSETTNICTVKPKVSLHDSINNIGPPFKNTSAFVLSSRADFALVPRGGEGEFCFGGSQIFRGYMDQNQNIGRIIEHPTFGRIYRSGDFGRLMPDGSLAFTGRKDDQIKIRGQRVELGEINDIMLRSKAVHDCVTIVMGGTAESSQRLVCFWTSGLGTSSQVECLDPNRLALTSLYKTLEAALPSYMIPSALIPISYLPSTSQGKIDKRQLTKLYEVLDVKYLDSTANTLKPQSDHTWTDTERSIARALTQYTKIPLQELNPETSFFNLGIDSISAIPFSRILRETLRCQVDISEILKYPSITRLGEIVLDRGSVAEEAYPGQDLNFGFAKDFLISTTDNFRKAGRVVERIIPCTPLQEAMLSASQSRSENLYSNMVVLNVSGSLEKLKASWQTMAQRHEILRTCFVETDNPRYAYAQIVLETFEPKFVQINAPNDVSQISGKSDISEPPYSFGVVQSTGSVKLVISMHHALYDGIALEVLYNEVEKLYHGQALLPAVSCVPFLDQMLSMKMEEADEFWQAMLKNCSPIRIKRINSDPPNRSSIHRRRATCSLSWIEERTKKHSTSLLAVCHAVWAALISERFQESDVCFGNVVSGRTAPIDGIERLVAPCFNTVPTRLQDLQKLTYLECFRKIQTLNAECLPFQLTPLRRIQSKFSPDGLRLFDTLFILQQPSRDLDSSIWSILEENGVMDFPLVCEVAPKGSENTLEIFLHSDSSFITTDDATTVIDAFNTRLQAALENPRRQLLSSAVKEQIISKSINLEVTTRSSKVSSSSKSMTAEELKIREVVSSFTDIPVDKITQDISIFRLGLDSITAVQVAARLRKQGHNVVASDVLEHSTISRLSAHLAQVSEKLREEERVYDFAAFDNAHREAICSKMGIQPKHIEAVRPCTSIQQGMIAQTLHSQGEQYVNNMWFELLPESSESRLKAAWMTVCETHEILRSAFIQTDDPKHPFSLATYAKENFPFHWFGEEEEIPYISTVEQLARRPWNLSIRKNDDKSMIKFTAHHALYDAQSMQLILSDVAKAYSSESLAPQSRINSLLGSILLHERSDVEDKKLFWQRDENKIVVNRFPDLTPLRISEYTNAVREVFSRIRTSDLEELCRQKGVTVQAAAQAAWARLLTAYTGESSNTFGMTLSGRSVHEEADSTPFPAIVTLPVSCNVIGTNEDLLSRTMNANALLHKYQFTPLTWIQRWAGVPEGNVFDTLFAYQKLPDNQEVTSPPWSVVREGASVDYSVSLEVQPTKSGDLALRLTFRESLIPAKHAEILLKQYDSLLLDILENPEGACDVAPELVTELLSITPAKDPILAGSVSLLHKFLEQGAHDYPEKNALEFATCLEPDNFQSQTWTYQEVNKESNKIAQLLCKRGIVPGQLVAICFDKCAEASFAIVGILKTGCAYVALDPNAPPERMSFIMQDSGAKWILTAGKAAQNFKSMDKEIVNLDSSSILHGYPSDPPKLARDISPEDTCYCLYTSGTTGTPKGCLITHENAVQAMYSFQRLFSSHWTESSKWLQFASFHFDVSVLEQFWSWSVGICVASAPRDLIFEDIPGAIQRLGITHIDLTPSLARLIHPDDVPALCKGVFITGGEQLRQEILDVWGEHACIYNGYGPTEATIGCTMYPRVPQNGKPSNIGPQFDNVGSYVLKPKTALPVLRGGIGELCVSGKLVGKGYLNRPDLTTERFPIIQPFNERVYRTGDLVRILHDGSFIFLGRADDQVKLRGQRLELSEINQVIKKSVEHLEEVVTLVLRHKAQQKEQLVTFFESSSQDDDNRGFLISIMKEACKARLPGYMVPTHFIPIRAVPLNANNKADAKQLAAMYDIFSVDDLQKLSRSSQEKPWTAGETEILDILARVLDIEVSSLTKEASIFELGLDSISIIGFSHALQTAGLSNAKLSVIKSNPAMEKLVGALKGGEDFDSRMGNAILAASQGIAAFSQSHIISICQRLGVESMDVESIAPCTPIQEGMIYRFLESQDALYFHSFDFSPEQSFDAKKLLAAWKRVVMRLEILRTKFVATDDGYAQVVMKSLEISEDQPRDYNATQKLVALETPHSFSITSTPSKNLISLRIFHGLYDGISLNLMLRRIVDEYLGLENIEYGPSFHSSLQYGPLVKVPGAEKFWRDHLKNWIYHPMPTSAASEKDVVVTRIVGGIDGFEVLRRNLGVTHQAMIQAAWLSVLQGKLSPVLTIGMVTSGRTIDFNGADKVIGPLFNTLPFHVKIDSGMTASSLISRCHGLNMQMQDFQHTPLKDIQKWSPARPGQSLFSTLFVFLRPEVDDQNFAKDVWTQLDEEQTADVRRMNFCIARAIR